MQDYLECPARYRYGHVVRIPTPASHQMVYGKRAARGRAGVPPAPDGRPADDASTSSTPRSTRHWESVGFLTREHEEARRSRRSRGGRPASGPISSATRRSRSAVEQEFTVGFGRDRLRGRYDRVDRDDDGRMVITDYKSSDVRDLATANRRARESLQLSIYALAHEAQHGSLPDELALHFLESGIVGRVAPSEKRLAKAQEPADARRPRASAPAASSATPSTDALRLLPLPRDLPRRRAMSGAQPRDRRRRSSCWACLARRCSWSPSPATRARSSTELQPCPDAPRNVVIVIGLAAATVALLVDAVRVSRRGRRAPAHRLSWRVEPGRPARRPGRSA